MSFPLINFNTKQSTGVLDPGLSYPVAFLTISCTNSVDEEVSLLPAGLSNVLFICIHHLVSLMDCTRVGSGPVVQTVRKELKIYEVTKEIQKKKQNLVG